ncbi:O-antigen ligase family protein [Sinomonas sp. JGH33]|uniref:O-antigen ligase family protein n=1 Tax=Sinomonas terricola TaxID=3110330 RepID=A0ABU5TBB8_9MICC|nr:O-antigen ligase family protein [Sinomonas sp. JGH33]MEA5456992.1 O-antigen ligase family protein [Sinomonas sp. JGH33]
MTGSTRMRDMVFWAATALLGVSLVAVLSFSRINADTLPVVVVGALAAVLAVICLVSSYLRLLVFVGGALAVMQADSSGIGALKPVYFAVIVLAAVAGMLRVHRLPKEIQRAYRPMFVASGVLFGLVAIEAVGSVFGGVDVLRVLRDATTYMMIVAAPWIASDAASTGGAMRARITAAAFCLVAAVGFAVYWLSARGVGTLSIDRLGMFSFVLAGCGFSLGIAYGLVRRNVLWLGMGLLSLVCVLVTGTRTGLLVLVALVAMVGSKDARKIPPLRLIGGLAALGVILAYVLPNAVTSLTSADFFVRRTSSLLSIFSEGISSDQSGVLRLRAYQTTLDVWNAHPLFGVGFGYQFPNPSPLQPPSDFQLDSPTLVLAKFGIFGTLVLAAAVLLIAIGIARYHIPTGIRSEAQTAGLGLVILCIALAALALPLEDKGFALGLTLILYLLGVEARTASSSGAIPVPHTLGPFRE